MFRIAQGNRDIPFGIRYRSPKYIESNEKKVYMCRCFVYLSGDVPITRTPSVKLSFYFNSVMRTQIIRFRTDSV